MSRTSRLWFVSTLAIVIAIGGVSFYFLSKPVLDVDIYVPDGYSIELGGSWVPGNVQTTMYEGLNVIRLMRNGEEFVCAVRVTGGGQDWISIWEREISPVRVLPRDQDVAKK